MVSQSGMWWAPPDIPQGWTDSRREESFPARRRPRLQSDIWTSSEPRQGNGEGRSLAGPQLLFQCPLLQLTIFCPSHCSTNTFQNGPAFWIKYNWPALVYPCILNRSLVRILVVTLYAVVSTPHVSKTRFICSVRGWRPATTDSSKGRYCGP